jgi:uncharacterized protein with LGFP repeats
MASTATKQINPKPNLAAVETPRPKVNGSGSETGKASASPMPTAQSLGMSVAPAMASNSANLVQPVLGGVTRFPLPPGIGAGIRIEAKHRQLGGDGGFLGAAVGDVQGSTDGRGYFRRYQGGSIYDGPGGTHEVHGAIRDRWILLGAETGFLGYPITDESGTPDSVGRYNHFQNGSIYWTPGTGAHETHGAIRDKWATLGWERSVVGYPLTDETGAPDGVGRYNHFQTGSIYWTPRTGAFETHGAIRDTWAALGWERSFLGYPTSDEGDIGLPSGPGRVSSFENGNIIWTPGTGALVTPASVQLSHPANTDNLPIGGWVNVVLNARGDVTFSGHLHNSGFDNIDYTVSVVVVSPSGASVGFHHSGHTEGTSAGLPFGTPNRDDDFVSPQGLNNQQIAAAWSQLRYGSIFCHVDATDTLVQGAEQFLGDLAQQALQALGSAAKDALVALIFA